MSLKDRRESDGSIFTRSDALSLCTRAPFAAKMSVISCLMLTLLATIVCCAAGSSPGGGESTHAHALACLFACLLFLHSVFVSTRRINYQAAILSSDISISVV